MNPPLDTCPRCLNPDNRPTAFAEHDHGTTAHYRCRHCTHTWTTNWGPRTNEPPYDEPIDDPWDDPEDQPGYWDRC